MTTRASVASDGTQANGDPGFPGAIVAISDRGRYVAFESTASNLTADSVPGETAIFLRHVPAHVWESHGSASNTPGE